MILSCDVHGWTSAATYKDVLVEWCHGWQGAAGATDGKELPVPRMARSCPTDPDVSPCGYHRCSLSLTNNVAISF
jgi:hypothetical protein